MDRLLLGDIFGKLFLVEIVVGSTTVEALRVNDLGDVSASIIFDSEDRRELASSP